MLVQEKVTKEKGTPPSELGAPALLRRGSLAPSPLQGHATKGRPWPIVALATSMSLNPFHGDFTRPPEGDLGVVFEIAPHEQNPNTTDFDLPEMSQARDLVPFRRPSGGVAQGGGAAWMRRKA